MRRVQRFREKTRAVIIAAFTVALASGLLVSTQATLAERPSARAAEGVVRVLTTSPRDTGRATSDCPPHPCVGQLNFSSTGVDPQGLDEVSYAGGLFFVTNRGSDTVSGIPGNGGGAPLWSVPVGNDPEGVAGWNNATVQGEVVVNMGSNNVSVLRLPYGGNFLSSRESAPAGDAPYGVLVWGLPGGSMLPEGTYAWVTDSGSNSVSVINLTSLAVAATIPVGKDPTGITFDPSGKGIDVVNSGSDNVSVIGFATDRVVANIAVGDDPTGAVGDWGSHQLYVSDSNCAQTPCGAGSVSVISTLTDTLNASISVGENPTGLAYDPTTGEIWVANTASDTVSVLMDDTTYAPNTVLRTLNVGEGPTAIYVSPWNDQTNVFVTNSGSNTLSWLVGTSLLSGAGLEHTSQDLTLGSALNFTVYGGANGGHPVTYTFKGLPPGCSSLNRSEWSCVPSSPGTFDVRVFVNDSVGDCGSAVMVVTVSAIFGLPPATFYELVTGSVLAVVVVFVCVGLLVRKRRRARAAPGTSARNGKPSRGTAEVEGGAEPEDSSPGPPANP